MQKIRCEKMIAALVAVMVLGFSFTACAGRDGDKETQQGTAASTSAIANSSETANLQENDYGWKVPEKTLSFTIYMGQGDQKEKTEKMKYMKDFYKEKFNVDINVQVFSSDVTEKLNLMLAANDYPEVISWMPDDMANKFIAQKRTVDLSRPIAAYGENINRRIGKYLNLLKEKDGSLHKLPTGWGETTNVAGYDFAARYDLWQETGLPMYKTLDEYYQTLKAIVAKHPTNKNGDKVYAISDNYKGDYLYGTMLAAYGFKNNYKVDASTGGFTHWMNTDEGLAISEYINRFYREGLIEPDFLSNDYETWLTKVFNEKIIGNIGLWWHAWTAGHEKWAQEDKDYTIEKRFMNATLQVPGVEEPTYLSSNYIGSYRSIITNKVKEESVVDEIVRFMDWECSELGNFIIAFGPPDPGNIWDIKDGKWIFKDNTMSNETKNENVHTVKAKFAAQEIWVATGGGRIEDSRIDPRISRVNGYDFWPINSDGSFYDKGVDICFRNSTAKPWDSTLFTVTYPSQDPIAITNQTIKDAIRVEWAKIITSKTQEEMETQFYKSRDALNQMGLKELTEYNQEQYKANKEIFSK